MCRNITPLRGLEPPASPTEVRAAALQFVRKVGSFSTIPSGAQTTVDAAVDEIAAVVTELLRQLPARKVAPAVEPPLRRRGATARVGSVVTK